MKHIEIIPDCPECGFELEGFYVVDSHDCTKPFALTNCTIDGWWECPECGYQSEHKPVRPYEDDTMYRKFIEENDPRPAMPK